MRARSGAGRVGTVLGRPAVWLSLLLLVGLLLAALCAPWLTPYAAEGAGLPNMASKLLAPSLAHPFGTDEMGRDLLARILFGARTSLLLAALVIGSSLAVGVVVGLAAGASGGWVDETAMRTTDIFLAFPPLLLAILLVAVLGGGFTSAVLALALAWWPFYAVLVRGQVVSVRGQPFIEAGETPRHVEHLPSVIGVLALLPAGADAQRQATAGEVIHGRSHTRRHGGLAKGNGRHERAELDALRVAGQPG